MGRAQRVFAQWLEYLALAMAVLAALAMVGIVAIIVAGVIMRRFANAPLHITEDMVGLMLSAVLFLGVPYVTLRSKHVRVAIIADAVNKRFAPVLTAAAMSVGLVFFGWIFLESLPWLEFAWKRGIRTETARLLLYPWMAVLPLSVALTWVIFVARFAGFLEAERHTTAENIAPIIAPKKED